MGFADALVKLGIRYDSHEALSFAAKFGRFIQERAHDASQELALERGSFPNWTGSTWDLQHACAMRNASCTTIAPTGSISIIAGCSSGIEPIYSFACRRRALDGREFIQVHPLIDRIGRREGWFRESIRDAILEGTPLIRIPSLPRRLADVLVTAQEIAPDWHVRVQAVFQEHLDSAVSKTVNLPASASVGDVDRVLRMAFRLGCKGITVYRDGSRPSQTLSAARESTKCASDVRPLRADPVSARDCAKATESDQDGRSGLTPGTDTDRKSNRAQLAPINSRCLHCIDS